MGDVVNLAELRDRRADRAAARAVDALMHPALRWTVDDGEDDYAHRRSDRGGGTVCGETGALILAKPGTDLCPDCYPTAASQQPSP